MRWAPAGPDTWRAGKYTIYRARMPEPVFWLSTSGGKPERMESREAVLERVSNG